MTSRQLVLHLNHIYQTSPTLCCMFNAKALSHSVEREGTREVRESDAKPKMMTTLPSRDLRSKGVDVW